MLVNQMSDEIFMNIVSKILSLSLLLVTSAQAQPFTIADAGEYDLETRTISSPGTLSKYFALNLQGSGNFSIRVRIGNQSATRSFLGLTNPRITSFLFSYDLADDVDISFRKGVVGKIVLEVLDGDGNVSSSTQIRVNRNYGEKGCSKHKSASIKTCRLVNLSNATRLQRGKLAKAFVKSLRRPIVLEP